MKKGDVSGQASVTITASAMSGLNRYRVDIISKHHYPCHVWRLNTFSITTSLIKHKHQLMIISQLN